MTMYLEHFGLREAPFKITPHTEFFFAGANRGETLEALLYAITSGEGIVKVTGEVGAGKTMLCRVLMERLPPTVETIYFAVPSLSPDELLATVASDLGVEADGTNVTKLIRALQSRLIEIYASGKRVVALIDEAHAMPVETLEQIRLLSNLETSHEKLIQIVLFGQPELDQHLSMPNIRQLKDRITHSFLLLPLPARDIKDYLSFRLRAAGYRGPDLFSPDALKILAEASEGLTRRINIYADKTLLAAYAAGTHTITSDHVRAAIADTQIVLATPKSNRNLIAFAIVLTLLVGVALGFLVGQSAKSPAPTATVTPIVKAAPVALTKSATIQDTGSGTPLEPAAAPSTNVSPALQPEAPKAVQTPKITPAIIDAAATSPVGRVPDANAKFNADWLGKRLQADAERLSTVQKNRYTIQLMLADERKVAAIESYLRVADGELKSDSLMLLATGSAAEPRVTVIYGSFAGQADSAAALNALGSTVGRFRPYVRSFSAIANEIRAPSP
ncbi:MAG: AAA family ATPase [Betaproteobacteria bacterium]